MKIFKYPLALKDEQEIEIVGHIATLSAAEVDGELVVYAIVDESADAVVTRKFFIQGTGNCMHPAVGYHARFLNTVVISGGLLVWHVFEAV